MLTRTSRGTEALPIHAMGFPGWADDVSETHWVGPVVVIGVVAVVLIFSQRFMTTRISFDVLESADLQNLKDSAKNNWTNIGVASALLITLVAAMMQADPLTPSGFELDEDTLINLEQTYMTLTIIAFGFFLLSILECVVFMSYVDPLTPADAVKFFLNQPDAIGDPITFLGLGSLCMYGGLTVWVWACRGAFQGFVMIVVLIVCAQALGVSVIRSASFDPRKFDCSFTQDEDAVRFGKEAPSQFKKQNTAKIRAIAKNMGKMVLDSQISEVE